MRPPRWAFFDRLLSCALLLGLVVVGSSGRADGGSLRLDQAEFLISDAIDPPGDSAPWQLQTLPDHWPRTRPGALGYAWYRLHFDLPLLAQQQQAILVPRLRTIGAVYVNGTHVGQSGDFGGAETGARAQLYTFRPELLRRTANILHVRLWVAPDSAGGLSAIRFGDQSMLTRALERERLLTVTSALMTCVFSATVGVYLLLIWLQRRREEMFGYFGLASLATALWLTGDEGYLPTGPATLAIIAGGMASGVLLLIYCLRFADWRWPRVERALWTLAIGVSLLEAIDAFHPSVGQWLPDLRHAWLVPHWGALMLMLVIVWRLRSTESVLLMLGHLYSVTTFAHYALTQHFEGIAGRSTWCRCSW